ncbi:hypothetical protein D6T65_04945 [Arthrobacter frigidicola]|nr:hypothetical protein D6T65_04945 [Arthrobacter frigidicola]
MAKTNQQKLDGLANGQLIWQQQLPLKAGDKAFHGTEHSAEHLLYLSMHYAKTANTRASRLESSVASGNAQIKGLVGAIAALSKGEPFDQAKLLAGVQAAAEAGVKSAIDSIETTVNLKETP